MPNFRVVVLASGAGTLFSALANQANQIGIQIVAEFLEALGEHKIDRQLQDNGRDMQLFLSPVKTKAELVREKRA